MLTDMNSKPILVTGPTGYVGGRLIPRLLESGYQVRAVTRSFAKLGCRPWAKHPQLEIIECDILDLHSLKNAMHGCRAAFYLIHSLDTAHRDPAGTTARNMTAAAAEAGVERLIYLGRLGGTRIPGRNSNTAESEEVGRILRSGPVPTTILRAALILGSGSAAFEVLRYLADRQPVMFAPGWFRTSIQPIGIRNVLWYLEKCLESNEVLGETFDIGGPDIVSYQDLIEIYTEETDLPRRMVLPLPLFIPRLSSYWIHLVTPVSGSIARSMAEGITSNAVCNESRIASVIPQRLLSCREVVRLAIGRIQKQWIETCWSDAGAFRPPEWTYCGDAHYSGGTILECGYRVHIEAPAKDVWKPIVEIGGQTGWYFGHFLWSMRGWMDRILGGAGLKRGRRHPSQLYIGDALDFWRVLDVQHHRYLALLAEMKVPGEAVLEFRLKPLPTGQTELHQLSRFKPKGLWGIIYWYSLYPFHVWLFQGLVRTIAKAVGKPITFGPQRFSSKVRQECPISTDND